MRAPSKDGQPQRMDQEATITADAPGVSDDASGTAAVMELARVLSRYEFEKTLVFIAFSGEEYGLVGAAAYAKRARDKKEIIDAVLNNDIIGNDLAGNGRQAGTAVRVFSEDPIDSVSRGLARYVKEIGERYVPSMAVTPVFRADRFGRGGDHTPFDRAGFPAVRFTTTAEFYANQHSASDTFANASPAYTARVAKVNTAVAASLAWAPPAPDVLLKTTSTITGRETIGPNLSRGKSGYDALLKWKEVGDVTDLSGYAIVMRDSTAPFWQRQVWAGGVKEFRLTDVSIDDIVLGVKAVDKEGNESPVSVYRVVPRALPE
ncbi:MAG: M20/M25/M40 family metallo-hydrolase [Acidobacteria bacterium]|nr:M20/M25/M40 family metallo-hydrolase [Acidobacteriota bacterium]